MSLPTDALPPVSCACPSCRRNDPAVMMPGVATELARLFRGSKPTPSTHQIEIVSAIFEAGREYQRRRDATGCPTMAEIDRVYLQGIAERVLDPDSDGLHELLSKREREEMEES